MIITIILGILGVISLVDIAILLFSIVGGNASYFSYYICRPFKLECFSLVIGFIIRIAEILVIGFTLRHFLSGLF